MIQNYSGATSTDTIGGVLIFLSIIIIAIYFSKRK